MGDGLRPLTERVVARLPGPRRLWVAGWVFVPWLNAGANLLLGTRTSAVWEQDRALVILNYAALSLAVLIALWGTARLASKLEELSSATARLLERRPRQPFREVNSVTGPSVAAAATALLFGGSALVEEGWTAAAVRGVSWLILGIALWTFLWTYASLQLGLDRLGRARLRAEAAGVDPGLGMRPLGAVAFTGLWMLLVWLVPVLLTAVPDVLGVAIGLLVLVGALATFFISVLRLHRQMVEVKAGELTIARRLYAEAYEPVRSEPTLAVLEQQRSLLAAADALEKRARAIHDWPIDEGTFARVVTIASSVVAVIVARLILDPFGL